jgi:ABC-type cobalt transport system substrate-binding protein
MDFDSRARSAVLAVVVLALAAVLLVMVRVHESGWGGDLSAGHAVIASVAAR